MSGRNIQMAFDLIEQPQAQSVLEPHISTLQACFRAAWQSWERFGAILPELRYVLAARTRAGFLNDHICQEVKFRFAGCPDASVEEARGLVLLTISNPSDHQPALTLRFKKLNRDLLSSNIQTAQQIDFARQLLLPGFPNVTRLTAGYQLDRLQSAIQDLWVTCAVQSNVLWAIPISDAGEGSGGTEDSTGIEIEFFNPGSVDGTSDAGQPPRVRPINVRPRPDEMSK